MPYENSSGQQCVVVGCKHNQRMLYLWRNDDCKEHNQLHKDCPCIEPYKLHTFPRKEDLRLQWVKAVNRKDFKPSTNAKVCSIHFLDGRPTKQNPDPVLHMGYTPQTPITPGRKPPTRRPFQPVTLSFPTNVTETPQTDSEFIYTATPLKDCLDDFENISNEILVTKFICCHVNPEYCQKRFVEAATQTEDIIKLDHAYAYTQPARTIGTQHTTSEFSIDEINSENDARFYTGLTLTVLMSLISTFSAFGKKLPYKMKVGDQILAVLMRLRLGLTFQDLSRRFNISKQLANAVYHSWIDIMSKNLSECMVWLPRETIRRTLPKSFKDTFPHTTCIIDCTEVFIQRPFTLKARAQTWSTYKSHNTAKFLIAIAPNGFIMYVSPLYGGRASDNYITKSCGFLNYLLPGDEVMADRGFTIGEDLCARKVKLNIPAFMKGRSQLSEEETIESRRIASVRIHVERAIMRMKSYRLLNTTLQIRSLKNTRLDKQIRVVAYLSNMHDSLIKDDSDFKC